MVKNFDSVTALLIIEADLWNKCLKLRAMMEVRFDLIYGALIRVKRPQNVNAFT